VSQEILLETLHTFGPLSSRQLAATYGIRQHSVNCALGKLKAQGEVTSMEGRSQQHGRLVLWEAI
jgi:hypothetical protein